MGGGGEQGQPGLLLGVREVFHVKMCHGSEPTLNLLVRPRSRRLELPGRAAKPHGAHPALHLPSSPCLGWSLQ